MNFSNCSVCRSNKKFHIRRYWLQYWGIFRQMCVCKLIQRCSVYICQTLALASSSAMSRMDSRLRWANSSLLSSMAIFICSFFCSSSCCRLTLFRFLLSSLSRNFCSRFLNLSSFLLSFSSSSCSFCFLKQREVVLSVNVLLLDNFQPALVKQGCVAVWCNLVPEEQN